MQMKNGNTSIGQNLLVYYTSICLLLFLKFTNIYFYLVGGFLLRAVITIRHGHRSFLVLSSEHFRPKFGSASLNEQHEPRRIGQVYTFVMMTIHVHAWPVTRRMTIKWPKVLSKVRVRDRNVISGDFNSLETEKLARVFTVWLIRHPGQQYRMPDRSLVRSLPQNNKQKSQWVTDSV